MRSPDEGGVAELMSIGTFARRSRLSLKALRLYDRLGLLPPSHTDPLTGRRRYREDQLFTARLILMLRRLDMPLAQVAEVIRAPGGTGAQLLGDYWDVIERRRDAQRDIVGRLRLSLLGGEARFAGHTVRQRLVPEQLVLTEQRHVRLAELSRWLSPTKARLSAVAQRYGGAVAPLFVVFHGAVSEDSDGPVEVCVPVAAAAGASGQLPVRCEPEHREAYVPVTRAQFEVPQILTAYDAVEQWIRSAGMRCCGAPREVYLPGVDIAAAGLDEVVCDVASPFGQEGARSEAASGQPNGSRPARPTLFR